MNKATNAGHYQRAVGHFGQINLTGKEVSSGKHGSTLGMSAVRYTSFHLSPTQQAFEDFADEDADDYSQVTINFPIRSPSRHHFVKPDFCQYWIYEFEEQFDSADMEMQVIPPCEIWHSVGSDQ